MIYYHQLRMEFASKGNLSSIEMKLSKRYANKFKRVTNL